MMYATTAYMLVLLVASFLIEGSQATPQAMAPTTTSVGATVATPSASQTAASLTFRSLPQPISCAPATFYWLYSGPSAAMSLQVTNVGVTQAAPPSTTTSLTTTSLTTTPLTRSSLTTTSSIASTRLLVRAPPDIPITPANLTVTVVADFDPINLSYIWNSVNVSQGWYTVLATISTNPIYRSTSSPFFVRTGTNTSCLSAIGVISPTNSHTPTITRSSTSQAVSSNSASNLVSTSTSKVPTIVGATVGMTFLVIALLILWFMLIRKRKSRTKDGGFFKNSFQRWKGSGDLRGVFVANAPNKRSRSSRFHLASQHDSIGSTYGTEYEDGIIGAEKKNPDEHGVALSTLPVLQQQSSRTRQGHNYSPSSSSAHVNDFVYPILSSQESGQGSDILRSHSLSTTGTQFSSSNSTDPSFPPPPPSAMTNKQIHRLSLGKKRKPAPVYNPSENGELISSSTPAFQHSTNTETSFPELSHKDSFGPGGIEGKPLHYLIPDMPLSQSN